MALPPCSGCGSPNTARVSCGLIGRTILISAATSKFKLIPNPPKLGEYYCNDCGSFYPPKRIRLKLLASVPVKKKRKPRPKKVWPVIPPRNDDCKTFRVRYKPEPMNPPPLKPSPEIKKYLRSIIPWDTGVPRWESATKADLVEFKKWLIKGRDSHHKRFTRRKIQNVLGKSISKMTLADFKNYHKPNYGAPGFLKELWGQLTRQEQALVEMLNERAFTFSSNLKTERQFMEAQAWWLERFFGREFYVPYIEDRPWP